MKLLTGKNKEQFEEWCLATGDYKLFNGKYLAVMYEDSHLIYFNELPFKMQIGVLLAYYDSLGINIDVMWIFVASSYSWVIGNIKRELGQMSEHCAGFNSRNEAYQEAFKKANELINS